MLQGALKSKTVWWNVLLAVLGGLELMGGHMTVLWGQEVAAAILMVGALERIEQILTRIWDKLDEKADK
jgi:hypothetical protein